MFFVDMDGVLFDWELSALNLLGGGKPSNYKEGVPIAEQLGISNSKLWKQIDATGREFWAGLKPYPWAEALIAELSRIDEVFICSSPSLDPGSCAGKLDALQKFFGKRSFRNYIFTGNKYLLAMDGRTLIDDKEKHVDKFTKKGGYGILFPRPWNRAANKSDKAFETVMDTVKMLYPGKVD